MRRALRGKREIDIRLYEAELAIRVQIELHFYTSSLDFPKALDGNNI